MKKSPPWKLTIGLILFSWVAGFLSLLSLLIVPALAWGVTAATVRKSWTALGALLLLNPIAMIFWLGIASYIGGEPHLTGVGLPGPEYYNIDRNTRCFKRSGGCVVTGNEWLFILPNNAAVRLMAFVFGPPRKSYDGPYPAREEAISLTDSAPLISVDEFDDGNVVLDGNVIMLDADLTQQLLGFYYSFAKITGDTSGTTVRAALFEERCMMVRITQDMAEILSHKDGDCDQIFLIDLNTKTPFARYLLAGDLRSQFPSYKYVAE